jgi:transcriptional regulator with PAS, ATPase and Fis domain
MVVLADENEPIGMEHLPPDRVAFSPAVISGGSSLRDEIAITERRVIGEALNKNQWNKSRAARDLKISYPCLLKKIKELGLERRAPR